VSKEHQDEHHRCGSLGPLRHGANARSMRSLLIFWKVSLQGIDGGKEAHICVSLAVYGICLCVCVLMSSHFVIEYLTATSSGATGNEDRSLQLLELISMTLNVRHNSICVYFI
jgi:hypothetical protein